jgi:hypothetical protein
MKKLTGSSCKSLMEAYSSIYDDTTTKLEEEKYVEFNQFIEVLINEGYDLSEYSYDELYNYYINEGIAGAVLKGLLKYGGKAWKAGKGIVKSGWKGSNVIDPKTGASKFVPGAEQSTRALAATLGRFAVPTTAAIGGLQYFTGNKGLEWIGSGIQSLRSAGHNLPSPGEAQRSIQNTQRNIQNNPLFQDPRKQKGKGVPSVPSWLNKEELELLDINYVNESPDWNSAPKNKPWATLTLGSETKINVPGLGWQFPATARNYFRAKGDPNWWRIPNPPQPEKPTPPTPSATPSATPPAQRPPATPPATPPAQRPPATPPAQRPPATPPATPPAQRPPATPPATPARPSGSGSTPAAAPTSSPMDAWEKANKRLAAAKAERERIRGTSQTDNPLMADLRSRLPAPTSAQNPEFQKIMSSGKYKDQGYQRLTQNPNVSATPASSSSSDSERAFFDKSRETAGILGLRGTLKHLAGPKAVPSPGLDLQRQSYEYDAFNLVLEYLFSQGHVETLDEALYVMMEMDSGMIQSIVEGGPLLPGEPGNHLLLDIKNQFYLEKNA